MSPRVGLDRPPEPATAARSPFGNLARIPGGMVRTGSDRHDPEDAPVRRVRVQPFWMHVHAVTNAEFRRFVKATGHVTVAERAPSIADYPDADLVEQSVSA